MIVVGIDIGTTKIACFIAKRGSDAGKVIILGFGSSESRGVVNGVVENINLTSQAIRDAMEKAQQDANIDVNEQDAHIYIGVAGRHIKYIKQSGTITIPQSEFNIITEDDLERLFQTQTQIALPAGTEIIHILPQDYIVDGQKISTKPVGNSGRTLTGNFNIVIGETNQIRILRHCVEAAGYHVNGIILEPIASAYAVMSDADREAGVALIDIGGGTTDTAILIKDAVSFTSVIPLAGNVITSDISTTFKILSGTAERIKVSYGSCLPSNVDPNLTLSIACGHGLPEKEIGVPVLADLINKRVTQILEMSDCEIRESGYFDSLINGVVLTGGGANLKDIKALAEYITTVNCRIGDSSIHIECANANNHDNKVAEYSNPKYATGIGLVLFGLEEEENNAKAARIQEQKKLETEKQKDTIDNSDININPLEDTLETPEKETPNSQEGFRAKITKYFKHLLEDTLE